MPRLIKSLSPLLLLWTVAAFGEETLREIAWPALRDAGQLSGGTVLLPDSSTAFPQLKVQNAQTQPATMTILTLERPPITSARYAIAGTIRYDGVQGQGFLEMWSVFPGGRYFSRTLAGSGPLRSLAGASDWRPFLLPFFNNAGAPPPTALIVNVVLPGRGTVYLGPLRLVQYPPGEDPLAPRGQWWSEQTAGWLGAILGSTLGILGGVMGWLATKGKARALVLGLNTALIGVGAVSLLLGLAALMRAQSYAVYYPLLLLGLICTGVGGFLARPLRQRYEALELRRIRAADAR